MLGMASSYSIARGNTGDGTELLCGRVAFPGDQLLSRELASDSLLAAKGGARAVDPNKLHHIFERGGHGLDDVVKAAGSREAAFEAMEKAAQSAFDAGKLAAGSEPGVYQGVVNVGGVDVTVRRAVVDGIFRIGSAWRP